MQLWGCSNCVCLLAGWNRGGGEGGAGRRQRAQPAEHPRCHHGEFCWLPQPARGSRPWTLLGKRQNAKWFFFLWVLLLPSLAGVSWALWCGGRLWNVYSWNVYSWLAGGFEWSLYVWKTEITVWFAQITTQAGAGPGWGPAVQAFTCLMGCLTNLVLFSLMERKLTVVSTVIILWKQFLDWFCFVTSVVLVASWGLCSLPGARMSWMLILFSAKLVDFVWLELDWWFCWNHFRNV